MLRGILQRHLGLSLGDRILDLSPSLVLDRIDSKKRRSRRNEFRRRSVNLEWLEERRMLTVDYDFLGGVLTIRDKPGLLASDHIVVDVGDIAAEPPMEGTVRRVRINEQSTGIAPHAITKLFVYGGSGDDFIDLSRVTGAEFTSLSDQMVRIYGEAGNDTIIGSEFGDLIFGGTGNDIIIGGPGDDVLRGGAGIDQLYGGEGNDDLQVDHATGPKPSLPNVLESTFADPPGPYATLIVRFDQDVLIGPNALQVVNQTGASLGSQSVGFAYDPGTFTANWSFPDNLLTDGSYKYIIQGTEVFGADGLLLDGNDNDSAGGVFVSSFVTGDSAPVGFADGPEVVSFVTSQLGSDYSQLSWISIRFDEDVQSTISTSSLKLTNSATRSSVFPQSVTYDTLTNTATWTFGASPVSYGYYTVHLLGAQIANSVGHQLLGDFETPGTDFRRTILVAHPGDLNLDGFVDEDEADEVISNLGDPDPEWAKGDVDDNGTIAPNDAHATIGNVGEGNIGSAMEEVPVSSELMDGGPGHDRFRILSPKGPEHIQIRDEYGVDIIDFSAMLAGLSNFDLNESINFINGAGQWDLLELELLTLHHFENVIGTNFHDVIIGDHLDNQLDGRGGNDVLYGRGGNDVLLGAAGNDVLIGGAGINILDGGTGNDTYRFGPNDGFHTIRDESGTNDRLDFSEMAEAVKVDLSSNVIAVTRNSHRLRVLLVSGQIKEVVGSPFDDWIVGNNANNWLDGGNGNDVIFGMGGSNVLLGGDGSDSLEPGDGIDFLDGGGGFDDPEIAFLPTLLNGFQLQANNEGFNQTQYIASQANAASAVLEWQISGVPAGDFELYATWLPSTSATTGAEFSIPGVLTKVVDQRFPPAGPRMAGRRFERIGSFNLGATSTVLTRLSAAQIDGEVIGDAVWLVPSEHFPTIDFPTVNPPQSILIEDDESLIVPIEVRYTNGELGHIEIEFGDGPPVGMQLVAASCPAGVDAACAEIVWHPFAGRPNGEYKITVLARDRLHPTRIAEESFFVQVGELNVPPTILTPFPPRTAIKGNLVDARFVARDADGDDWQLRYSLASDAPAGAQIDAITGVFAWDTTNATLGAHPVTVIVTDNGQPNLSTEYEWEVRIVQPGAPTVISAPITITMQEDTTFSFTAASGFGVGVADPDSPTIRVSVVAQNGIVGLGSLAGATEIFQVDGSVSHVNQTLANLRFRPNANFAGETFIRVEAEATTLLDLNAVLLLGEFTYHTIAVAVVDDNSDPPTILPQIFRYNSGHLSTIGYDLLPIGFVKAEDPDKGQRLTYAIFDAFSPTQPHTKLAIDPRSGRLRFREQPVAWEVIQAIVTVTDDTSPGPPLSASAPIEVRTFSSNSTDIATRYSFSTAEDVALTNRTLDIQPNSSFLQVTDRFGRSVPQSQTFTLPSGAQLIWWNVGTTSPVGTFTYDPHSSATLNALADGERYIDAFEVIVCQPLSLAGYCAEVATTVEITVNGRDDPMVIPPQTFPVRPSAKLGDEIGVVHYNDPDTTYAGLNYLDDWTWSQSPFELDRSTGTIYLARPEHMPPPGGTIASLPVRISSISLADGTVHFVLTEDMRPYVPGHVYHIAEDVLLIGDLLSDDTGQGVAFDPDTASGGSGGNLELVAVDDVLVGSDTSTIELMGGGLLTVSRNGQFTFDPRGSSTYNRLSTGDKLDVTFDIVVTDKFGAQPLSPAIRQQVAISVHGRNDMPTAEDVTLNATNQHTSVEYLLESDSWGVSDPDRNDILRLTNAKGNTIPFGEGIEVSVYPIPGMSGESVAVHVHSNGRIEIDARSVPASQLQQPLIYAFPVTVSDGSPEGNATFTVSVIVEDAPQDPASVFDTIPLGLVAPLPSPDGSLVADNPNVHYGFTGTGWGQEVQSVSAVFEVRFRPYGSTSHSTISWSQDFYNLTTSSPTEYVLNFQQLPIGVTPPWSGTADNTGQVTVIYNAIGKSNSNGTGDIVATSTYKKITFDLIDDTIRIHGLALVNDTGGSNPPDPNEPNFDNGGSGGLPNSGGFNDLSTVDPRIKGIIQGLYPNINEPLRVKVLWNNRPGGPGLACSIDVPHTARDFECDPRIAFPELENVTNNVTIEMRVQVFSGAPNYSTLRDDASITFTLLPIPIGYLSPMFEVNPEPPGWDFYGKRTIKGNVQMLAGTPSHIRPQSVIVEFEFDVDQNCQPSSAPFNIPCNTNDPFVADASVSIRRLDGNSDGIPTYETFEYIAWQVTGEFTNPRYRARVKYWDDDLGVFVFGPVSSPQNFPPLIAPTFQLVSPSIDPGNPGSQSPYWQTITGYILQSPADPNFDGDEAGDGRPVIMPSIAVYVDYNGDNVYSQDEREFAEVDQFGAFTFTPLRTSAPLDGTGSIATFASIRAAAEARLPAQGSGSHLLLGPFVYGSLNYVAPDLPNIQEFKPAYLCDGLPWDCGEWIAELGIYALRVDDATVAGSIQLTDAPLDDLASLAMEIGVTHGTNHSEPITTIGITSVSPGGSFSFSPADFAGGYSRMFARVVYVDDTTGEIFFENWSHTDVYFVAPPSIPASLEGLALASIDSVGSTGLPYTSRPTLVAQIVDPDGYVGGIRVAFSHSPSFHCDNWQDALVITTADDTGRVSQRLPLPMPSNPTQYTIRTCVEEWDYQQRAFQWVATDSITFMLTAAPNAIVNGLKLLSDTGQSQNDDASTNVTITGRIENVENPGGTRIEYVVDPTAAPDPDTAPTDLVISGADGVFYFTPSGIAFGPHIAYVRGQVWNSASQVFEPTDWQPFGFELLPPAQEKPILIDLEIAEGRPISGLPENNFYEPVLTGRIINDFLGEIEIVVNDMSTGSSVDFSGTTDDLGNFTIRMVRPSTSTSLGQINIQVTARQLYDSGAYLISDPAQLSYHVAGLTAPYIQNFGVSWQSPTTLEGTVALPDGFPHPLTSVDVIYGFHQQGPFLGVGAVDENGHFSFDLEGYPAGSYTIWLRTRAPHPDAPSGMVYGIPDSHQIQIQYAQPWNTEITSLGLLVDPSGPNGTPNDGLTNYANTSITGQIFAWGSLGGYSIEFDFNHDREPEAGATATTNANGSFVLASGIVNNFIQDGFVTVRARVADSFYPSEWFATNFVVHESLDDPTALSLVNTLAAINPYWQVSQSLVLDLTDASGNVQLQLQQALAALGAAYELQLEFLDQERRDDESAADLAFQQQLAELQAAYRAAVVSAAGVLNTSLAQANLPTYTFQAFRWPEWLSTSNLNSNPSSLESGIPFPTYSGNAFDYAADPSYKNALSNAELQYAQSVRNAQSAYTQAANAARQSHNQARETARQNLLADQRTANDAWSTRNDNHPQWNAGNSLYDEHADSQQLLSDAWNTYRDKLAASYDRYLADIDGVPGWVGWSPHLYYYQWFETIENALHRLRSANAAAWRDLQLTIHSVWPEMNEKAQTFLMQSYKARLESLEELEGDLAQAAKDYSYDLAEAERIYQHALADAQFDRDEAIASANRVRTMAQAVAMHSSYQNWATSIDTNDSRRAWADYQTTLAANYKNYAEAVYGNDGLQATRDAALNAAKRTEAKGLATAVEFRSRDTADAVFHRRVDREEVTTDYRIFVNQEYGEANIDLTYRWHDLQSDYAQINYTAAVTRLDAWHTYVIPATRAARTLWNSSCSWPCTSELRAYSRTVSPLIRDLQLAYADADETASVDRINALRDYRLNNDGSGALGRHLQLAHNVSDLHYTYQAGLATAAFDYQVAIVQAESGFAISVASREASRRLSEAAANGEYDIQLAQQTGNWSNLDSQSRRSFELGAVDAYVSAVTSWAQSLPGVPNVAGQYQVALAQAEKTRILALHAAEVQRTQRLASANLAWNQAASSAYLAFADALYNGNGGNLSAFVERVSTIADAYVENAEQSGFMTYSVALASARRVHTRGVATEDIKYQRALAHESAERDLVAAVAHARFRRSMAHAEHRSRTSGRNPAVIWVDPGFGWTGIGFYHGFGGFYGYYDELLREEYIRASERRRTSILDAELAIASTLADERVDWTRAVGDLNVGLVESIASAERARATAVDSEARFYTQAVRDAMVQYATIEAFAQEQLTRANVDAQRIYDVAVADLEATYSLSTTAADHANLQARVVAQWQFTIGAWQQQAALAYARWQAGLGNGDSEWLFYNIADAHQIWATELATTFNTYEQALTTAELERTTEVSNLSKSAARQRAADLVQYTNTTAELERELSIKQAQTDGALFVKIRRAEVDRVRPMVDALADADVAYARAVRDARNQIAEAQAAWVGEYSTTISQWSDALHQYYVDGSTPGGNAPSIEDILRAPQRRADQRREATRDRVVQGFNSIVEGIRSEIVVSQLDSNLQYLQTSTAGVQTHLRNQHEHQAFHDLRVMLADRLYLQQSLQTDAYVSTRSVQIDAAYENAAHNALLARMGNERISWGQLAARNAQQQTRFQIAQLGQSLDRLSSLQVAAHASGSGVYDIYMAQTHANALWLTKLKPHFTDYQQALTLAQWQFEIDTVSIRNGVTQQIAAATAQFEQAEQQLRGRRQMDYLLASSEFGIDSLLNDSALRLAIGEANADLVSAWVEADEEFADRDERARNHDLQCTSERCQRMVATASFIRSKMTAEAQLTWVETVASEGAAYDRDVADSDRWKTIQDARAAQDYVSDIAYHTSVRDLAIANTTSAGWVAETQASNALRNAQALAKTAFFEQHYFWKRAAVNALATNFASPSQHAWAVNVQPWAAYQYEKANAEHHAWQSITSAYSNWQADIGSFYLDYQNDRRDAYLDLAHATADAMDDFAVSSTDQVFSHIGKSASEARQFFDRLADTAAHYRKLTGLADFVKKVNSARVIRDAAFGQDVSGQQTAINDAHDAALDDAAQRFQSRIAADEGELRQKLAHFSFDVGQSVGTLYSQMATELANAKRGYTQQLAGLLFSAAGYGLEQRLADASRAFDELESAALVQQASSLADALAGSPSAPWGNFFQTVTSSKKSLFFDPMSDFVRDQRLSLADGHADRVVQQAGHEYTQWVSGALNHRQQQLAALMGGLAQATTVGITDRTLPGRLTAPDFGHEPGVPYSRLGWYPSTFTGQYDYAFNYIVGVGSGLYWYGFSWVGLNGLWFYGTYGHNVYSFNGGGTWFGWEGYGGLFSGYWGLGSGSGFGWGAGGWAGYGAYNGLWGYTGYWNGYGYQSAYQNTSTTAWWGNRLLASGDVVYGTTQIDVASLERAYNQTITKALKQVDEPFRAAALSDHRPTVSIDESSGAIEVQSKGRPDSSGNSTIDRSKLAPMGQYYAQLRTAAIEQANQAAIEARKDSEARAAKVNAFAEEARGVEESLIDSELKFTVMGYEPDRIPVREVTYLLENGLAHYSTKLERSWSGWWGGRDASRVEEKRYVIVSDSFGEEIKTLVLEYIPAVYPTFSPAPGSLTSGGLLAEPFYKIIHVSAFEKRHINQGSPTREAVENVLDKRRSASYLKTISDAIQGGIEENYKRTELTVAEFLFHMIPLAAAANFAQQGEYKEAAISLVGDAATLIGAPLRLLQGGKILAHAAVSKPRLITATLLEAGVGGLRLGQGIAVYSETKDASQAAGYFGEAALRLLGVSLKVNSATLKPSKIGEVISDTLCFSRNTPVAIAGGTKPIGAVEAGETIRAFDFSTNSWIAAKVVQRHDDVYTGDVVTIHLDNESIEVTAGHPFWVVNGWELGDRPDPRALGSRENEGHRPGRWVDSDQLRVGDVLLGEDGEVRIERVEIRHAQSFVVSNLTVEGHHNFAIGSYGLLVHNLAWCDHLKRKIGEPPAALRSTLNALKATGQIVSNAQIHAHHIVMKTIPSQIRSLGSDYVREFREVLTKSHKILDDAKIKKLVTKDDLFRANANELHNMAWAINAKIGQTDAIHTLRYAKEVLRLLEDAWENNGANGIRAALAEMRDHFHNARVFW